MVGVRMDLALGFPGCLLQNRVYCTRRYGEFDGFEGTVTMTNDNMIYVKLDPNGTSDGVWVDATGGHYEITVLHS